MTSSRPAVCVFAGSSMPNDPELVQLAKFVGREIADEDLDLIYGGGLKGLMGVVAQEAYDAGANIRAVVCRDQQDDEQLDGLMPEIVKDSAARFNRYARDKTIKGFVVLPGVEAITETMGALDLRMNYKGPPVLLTKLPQLEPVRDMFNVLVNDGFIESKHRRALKNWDPEHSLRATLKIQTPHGYRPGLGGHTG